MNTSIIFNTTEPILGDNNTLDYNESLLVIIEEDYSQGKKQPLVQVFNSTYLEDKELDVFNIRQIDIQQFETLHENSSWAITSALVINNIAPLNLSWQLNNTQELISSINNTELSTGEQAFIVIESNFSNSGIYPLTMMINSSDKNDNQTGVAVS